MVLSAPLRASQVVLVVKNPSAEMQVRSLGGEDPLEEEVATHSSVLASRIHGRGALGAMVCGVSKNRT